MRVSASRSASSRALAFAEVPRFANHRRRMLRRDDALMYEQKETEKKQDARPL